MLNYLMENLQKMTAESYCTLREAAESLAKWDAFSIKLRNNIAELREMLKNGSIEAFVSFGGKSSQIPISKQFWINANSSSFNSLLKSHKKPSYTGTYQISFKQALNEYLKKNRDDKSGISDALNEISDQAKSGPEVFEVFICRTTLETTLKNQGLKPRSSIETEKRGRKPKENWTEVMIEVAVLLLEEKTSNNFLKYRPASYYAEEALKKVKEENLKGSFPAQTTLEPKITDLLNKLDK